MDFNLLKKQTKKWSEPIIFHPQFSVLPLQDIFFEKSKPVGFLKKKRRERVPERTNKL
jgi:hypothetical protein